MSKNNNYALTDKTEDEWDNLVDSWHNGAGGDKSLQEYLGLDDEEYLKYMWGEGKYKTE